MVVLSFGLVGCEAAAPRTESDAPAASVADSASAAEAAERADSLIYAGALEAYAYTLLDSASFELDGDADPERIELLATVERDARGTLLWEDGHHWAVVVRDDSLVFPLVERFLPWGRAEFFAVREEPGGAAVVVVLTRAGAGCGHARGDVGFTAEKFSYAGVERAFALESTVASAGSGVCRGEGIDP